ncbi:MAG TPA: hypothetical protein VLG40_01255 [Candidatus Saccharimonas sp.]|nr:hypothetical protein [Candidatus Saccharimonas sp.]
METSKEVTKAPEVQKDDQQQKPPVMHGARNHRVIVAIIGGLIVLALGFMLGSLSTFHFVARRPNIDTTALRNVGPFRAHDMRGGFNGTDGSTVTRLSGVVTQVNGATFTIAGNGTTKTITTNDSTVFNTGSKKVNVNDSVLVTGTDGNSAFTAATVHVQNS